jgi:TatD DNase family protein
MNFPKSGDYIDIHTHVAKPVSGVFIIDSLMAHEDRLPINLPGVTYTFGIHPWFLNEDNYKQQIESVENSLTDNNIIAIGEAGFDKLRGPSSELQRKVFEEQVVIADDQLKPVIIHCVKAWEELLAVHKKLKPKTPWLIHGFRGNAELASQLLLKGLYLSFWFDFALRPESSKLLKSLPKSRIFLETDGADVNISSIYEKLS